MAYAPNTGMVQRRLLLGSLGSLASLGAFAVTACSLTTDLNGYAGELPLLSSEGGDDAGLDARAEATGPSETGGDAPIDAGPFCTDGHSLCADFDQGELLDRWTRDENDAKASSELSTAHFVSPGRSFRASIARRASGDLENALLVKDTLGIWRPTVLDFDFYLAHPDWKAGDINASFVSVSFSGMSAEATVFWTIGDGYSQLTAPGMNIAIDPPPYDTFIHVHLDIIPSKSVDAVINGKTYHGNMSATAGPGQITVLALGINGFNAPVPAFSAFYDNVVLDVK